MYAWRSHLVHKLLHLLHCMVSLQWQRQNVSNVFILLFIISETVCFLWAQSELKKRYNTAGTEYERLCNAFRLLITWLASDWTPLAPMGPFSSSRGPSSISSASAGTWHSSVTWQSAWLVDLIGPDISILPCDPSQTSEASTSVHWGTKVIHSIKTKLHSQSQDMTTSVTRNDNNRDCLPLAGALNTGRSKPAFWC